MTDPFRLDGQVAIITGSSRGIGMETAKLMARQGAKVVVSSRKAESCQPVVDAIKAEGGEAIVIPCNISRKAESCQPVVDAIKAEGGEAIVIPCNISRKAEVEALVKGTMDQFGRIDVLVCNAASNPAYGPMQDLSDDAFDKIMNNNIKSNLWLSQLVIPGMAERGGGAVIIISSIAGLRASPMIGAYGVSKAADFALARNLAVEWSGKNIRVNCVAPGLVKTDFAKALWEDEKRLAKRNAMTPLQRIGEPHEIAAVATFLAAPASSFITGQIIVADGGVTIA